MRRPRPWVAETAATIVNITRLAAGSVQSMSVATGVNFEAILGREGGVNGGEYFGDNLSGICHDDFTAMSSGFHRGTIRL